MRALLRWIVIMTLAASTLPALAQVRVSITVGPPPIPVYEQPFCPGDGYIWAPGYWAWDDLTGGYYWVPGTWLLPPAVGLLWTPGYWAWQDTAFVFVRGYWGPVVGFYGGINYGFGYPGHGYYGGRWTDGHFFYNRSVTNLNVTVVRNTYIENVVVERSPNRVSYNGGKDGIVARPTAPESVAAKEKHLPETEAQAQHVQHARSVPELHAAQNNGKPPVLAMVRPEASRDQDLGSRRGEASRNPSPPAREAERGGAERSGGDQRPKPQTPPQARPERAPGNQSGTPRAEGERSNERARPEERAQPDEHARPEQRRDAPIRTQQDQRPQTKQRSKNEHEPKTQQENKHEKEPGEG